MSDNKVIAFDNLEDANLIVDAVYKGGTLGNMRDDPISKLVGGGNQGGFRYEGSTKRAVHLCVLYSELTDPDWPDSLDVENGLFTYYGDNKRPGQGIVDTKRKGNIILQQAYDNLHLGRRDAVPPFFIFTKGPQGRDVVFRGLAVPGGKSISQTDDLVAVWKTKSGSRFANYRATFTILDVSTIPKSWIREIQKGERNSAHTPEAWTAWIRTGRYTPLLAPRVRTYRNREEQLPAPGLETDLIARLVKFFKNHPEREYAFERCAGEIARLMDKNITELNYTRYWSDGGRDAIGKYKLGTSGSSIHVDFAMEAKCKKPSSGSGIIETSRLISRIKYRQFGIFVTTSYVGREAYKEIIEDGQPIVILSGHDIAAILVNVGINTPGALMNWLEANFLKSAVIN